MNVGRADIHERGCATENGDSARFGAWKRADELREGGREAACVTEAVDAVEAAEGSLE